MHIPFMLTHSEFKGWGESEVILLYFIKRRWTRDLRCVAEPVEPNHLNAGVLEMNSRVEIKQPVGGRFQYRKQML